MISLKIDELNDVISILRESKILVLNFDFFHKSIYFKLRVWHKTKGYSIHELTFNNVDSFFYIYDFLSSADRFSLPQRFDDEYIEITHIQCVEKFENAPTVKFFANQHRVAMNFILLIWSSDLWISSESIIFDSKTIIFS